jgi:hypothetical protein
MAVFNVLLLSMHGLNEEAMQHHNKNAKNDRMAVFNAKNESNTQTQTKM